MPQVRVLDLAFSAIPDVGWVERRKAEGVVAIFQNVWTGGYANNSALQVVARPNLEKIFLGGCIPCVYTNAAPWRTPTTWYNESMNNMGGMSAYVDYVMVDIEIGEGGNPIQPQLVNEFIYMWRDSGRAVCTYSADWYVGFWALQLGYIPTFPVPYVHARYDGVADMAVSTPLRPIGPLGGKQYRGSHSIEGVSVDASVMDAAFFGGMDIPMNIDDILTTPEQRDAFARFFTPVQWMDYDRATNSPIRLPGDNGIPWFGRNGTAPSDMLAVCQGYADSVHFGTVLAALGATAPSDPGNLRKQIADAASTVSTEELAKALATALTNNMGFMIALGSQMGKALANDLANRLEE